MHQNTILYNQDLLDELAAVNSSCLSMDITDTKCDEMELAQISAKIRQAWNFAAFSDVGEDTLNRYFTYQAKFIAALLIKYDKREKRSNHFENSQSPLLMIRSLLCALLDYLYHYFSKYVDQKNTLPPTYRFYFINQNSESISSLYLLIERPEIDEKLCDCLRSYINAMVTDQGFETYFYQLRYFRTLVNELAGLGKIGDELDVNALVYEKLLQLNFNHLDVFSYHQQSIKSSFSRKTKAKKQKIIHEKLVLFDNQVTDNTGMYDPKMRSLPIMLSGWLREELGLLSAQDVREQQYVQDRSLRLQLQLSISHLSFLIRLFYKQSLFGAIPLTDIFDFFAANFSSKRQEVMSSGGISKEYYTKNMVTAAEIKALLLKMIAQINLDYFPVVAAIGAVIFYH